MLKTISYVGITDVATMRTDFMPDRTAAIQLVEAFRLLVADFDGRSTTRVIGTGGRSFEFFPTAITDNIPPLEPRLSHAVCLLSRFHLEHVAEATLGVGEEDRGAMIISDLLLSHNLARTLARWTPTGAPGEIRKVLSRVDQVHLGRMPAQLAEEVASHFPPGFCIFGSGGDSGSI
jgi:hypothetical protein